MLIDCLLKKESKLLTDWWRGCKESWQNKGSLDSPSPPALSKSHRNFAFHNFQWCRSLWEPLFLQRGVLICQAALVQDLLADLCHCWTPTKGLIGCGYAGTEDWLDKGIRYQVHLYSWRWPNHGSGPDLVPLGILSNCGDISDLVLSPVPSIGFCNEFNPIFWAWQNFFLLLESALSSALLGTISLAGLRLSNEDKPVPKPLVLYSWLNLHFIGISLLAFHQLAKAAESCSSPLCSNVCWSCSVQKFKAIFKCIREEPGC